MKHLYDDPNDEIMCDKDGIGGEGSRPLPDLSPEKIRSGARLLRIAVVRNLLGSGNLERADALELLRGCLTPGDESTRVDDSGLIDLTFEEVRKAIEGE